MGTVRNKYPIIDIFSSAGGHNVQDETEKILWKSSRNHRVFLGKNFEWYPRILGPSYSLKSQSKELKTLQQA